MVLSVDFSQRGTKPLVHKDVSDLIALVPWKMFQLPEECIESSLSVYQNQGVLDRTSDNGFNVLSPLVFELKQTLDPARVSSLHVSYQPA